MYLILKNAFHASLVFNRINWIYMEFSPYSLRLEFWSSFMEKPRQDLFYLLSFLAYFYHIRCQMAAN